MKTNQSVRRHELPAASRPRGQPHPPDFSIYGSGTVYLFHPLSATAQAWLAAHCPPSADHQYLGQNLAVEFRYAADIIRRAIRDGLTPAANTSTERSVS